MSMKTNKLAIFISGKGSNALNLISFLKNSKSTSIELVFSTKENNVLKKTCAERKIAFHFSDKKGEELELEQTRFLHLHRITFIVLAGYLKKISKSLIALYPNKIINLHPSLLPKHGGKGMYGQHVHQAVLEAKESYSGITIHYVNDAFDEGQIIAQFSIALSCNETSESLNLKIRGLEKKHFGAVIAQILMPI